MQNLICLFSYEGTIWHYERPNTEFIRRAIDQFDFLRALSNVNGDENANQKTFWSLLKAFLNNKKVLCIPSFFHENKFITDFKKKKIFLLPSCSKIFERLIYNEILVPLLFLIYINDLSNELYSNCNLFADDTSPFSVVNTIHTSAITFRQELNAITN